jgi:predicted DCC family thiol-disulfide oxidoreductase YuxK
MTGVLLRDILGATFDEMPEPVRRMHSIGQTQHVRGISRVVGGNNPLSWIIRILAALPRPVHRAPVYIRFVKREELEEWDRHFGDSRFRTVMKREGQHLAEHLVAFPVVFVYEVKADRRGFSLHVMQVRFLGIPLPRPLRPHLMARAREWRGRYRFSTVVGFWFCGRVISYFGYLDAPRTSAEDTRIIIVYDGLCNLCSGSIAWIARRIADRVRFVPAQSGEGTEILQAAGLNALDPSSFLVVKNGQTLQKSAGVVAVLNLVGGGYKLGALLLRLMPRSITDKIYDFIAANRYKWFGKRETCFVPRA